MSVTLKERTDSYTRLQGRWLRWGRFGWLAMALLAVGVFLASIPVYYHQSITLSEPLISNPEVLRVNLAQAGLSPEFHAIYFLIVGVVFALIYLSIAVLIFARRADDRVALLFSLFLVLLGVIFTDIPTALDTGGSLGQWIYRLLNFLSYALFILAFHIFPNGRFDPAWTRWWALVLIVLPMPNYFLEGTPYEIPVLRAPIEALSRFLIPVVSILFGTIYRYTRRSNATERQQTKWVVFGITIGLVAFIGAALPSLVAPGSLQDGTPVYFIVQTLFYGFMTFIPLSIGMGILRSKLWDIDIIIRRTLIYGLLTALLLLFYFGSVVLLQELFHLFTGNDSPLAVVASTVAIAALFNPLRRAIQGSIDRRFYRRKYDEAQTVAAFGETVRNEVNLNVLVERLIAETEETLQPNHVSLWLRKGGYGR